MTWQDNLEPGRYLVGKDSGDIEPFFVQVIIDEDGDHCLLHHVSPDLIDCALHCCGWYWRDMQPPNRLPCMADFPDTFVEPPWN